MKRLLFLVSCILHMNCQPKSSGNVLVTAIKDGVVTFSDGSTRTLPHHEDPEYTTIFLVRHCEKAKDGTNDPDLTEEGYARAAALGRILQHAGLDQVATTPYKRTKKTGDAVWKKAKLAEEDRHIIEKQESWLDEVLAQPGKRFLYVGHQNTVPFLLNRLLGKYQYEDIPDYAYGRLYVAIVKKDAELEILELEY